MPVCWFGYSIGMNKKLRPVIFYGVLLVYTLAPFICNMGASAVADHFGCRVSESTSYPCAAFGRDIGDTLGSYYSAYLWGLFTLPTGVIGIIIYTLGLLGKALFKRKAN